MRATSSKASIPALITVIPKMILTIKNKNKPDNKMIQLLTIKRIMMIMRRRTTMTTAKTTNNSMKTNKIEIVEDNIPFIYF